MAITSTLRLAIILGLGTALSACGGSAESPSSAEETASTGGTTAAAAPEPSDDPEPPAPPPATEPAAEESSLAPGDDTPATYACRLANDYNACIVERLEGRASTEADMILLIQSLRFLGRADDARAQMREFVDTYPDSPQSQAYRDYLGGI